MPRSLTIILVTARGTIHSPLPGGGPQETMAFAISVTYSGIIQRAIWIFLILKNNAEKVGIFPVRKWSTFSEAFHR